MKKRFLSILLTLVMLLPLFPATPIIAAPEEIQTQIAAINRISNIYLDGEPLAGFSPGFKDYKVQLAADKAFPVITVDKTEEDVIERITQAEGSNNSAIIRLDKPGDKYGEADIYIVTFLRKPTEPVFRTDANGLAEWYNGNGLSGANQRSVPQINQEEPRSIFVPFNSEADALANPVYSKMEESTNFLSLNGEWDFHLANYAFGTNGPPDISGAAFVPDAGWTKIKVPGTWQVNWDKAGVFGDTPIYTNSAYPWTYYGHAQGNPNAPRTQTGNRTPVGSYYRTFNVPANWASDKHVTLSFQGAGQGIYVWVNGHAVGYAEDTFTASEFDITPYIVAGENKLAVRCYRWTQGGFLENQDMINTSGLFRDVFVFAEPKARIRDFAIFTDLFAPYTEDVDATLNVTAILNNRYGAAGNYTVSVNLYDANGQKVNTPSSGNVWLAAGEEYKEIGFLLHISNPKKWSAEHPNLYTITLTLSNSEGVLTESLGRKVGFRKFYMSGAGTDEDPVRMYINGKPIYLKGVNRGENNPFGGISIPREDMDAEVLLMKRNNINAVRTSHYPSDPYMYELFDKFGLYVMDEFNIESHNGRSAGIPDDRSNATTEYPVWRNSLIQRVKNCVLRDRNHPSVILWSTSNESGFGPNHRRGADWIEVTDPSRLIHNQGIGSDNYDPRYPPTGIRKDAEGRITQNTSVTAISSIFYPKVVNEVVNYNNQTTYTQTALSAANYPFGNDPRRFPFANEVPRIFCEMEHAMGNSGGGLFVYTDAIEANPHTQGCFIWDWRDQSIYTVGADGKGFFGYGGDWGTSFGDGDFCGNGVGVLPDGTPNPAIAEVKKDYQDIKMSVDDDVALLAGNINFYNRALFTDPTSAYDCVYTVTTDVKPDSVSGDNQGLNFLADPSGMYIVDSGTIDLSGKLPPIADGNALSTPDEIKKVINVPYSLPAAKKAGAEYYLNIYFIVKEGSTSWAEKGHIASSEQFKIPASSPNSRLGLNQAPDFVSVNETDSAINITGKTADNKDFSVVISKTTGLITEYKADGRVLIENGPVPSFARAPIPNDMGGQNLGGRASGINTNWRDAGKNKTVASVAVDKADKLVSITIEGTLASKNGASTARPSDYSIEYKIFGNGDVEIKNDVSPNRQAYQYMSMVGGYLTLPGGYENVTYYGRGPDENYIDRRSGQSVELYETNVDDMYINRLRPQEYGNRTDVRWIAMTDDDGYGLMAISDSVMEFSAKRWDIDQLSTWNSSGTKNGPLHPSALPESSNLYLTLMDIQQGVGGEDWSSGPYGPGYANGQGTGQGGTNNGLPNGSAFPAAWYPRTNPTEYNFYVQNNKDYSYTYTLRPVFPAENQALAMMDSSKQLLLDYEPEVLNPPIIEWTGNEWDSNAVYAINREDPHAMFYPYSSIEAAKEFHNYYPEKSEYYQSLNGTWKFNHVMRPDLRPMANGVDSFETPEFDAGEWDDITVPSNWQVNWNEDGTLKYDQPIYVNSSTPWARAGMNNGTVTYPSAPKNGFNPVGTYRTTFTVDPAWKGRSVFLNLDGVESNCYIWVNGYKVGYAEDSFTGKAFDLTPFIYYNETNVIAIQVFRWSSASWFENQDMMRLSGIFRDIYLTSRPKVALYDAEVKTTPVTENKFDGDWNLNIKALLRDLGASDTLKNGAALSAKLYDADDNIVGTAVFGQAEYTVRKNKLNNDFAGADLSYNMTVTKPKLWSAEHPNLYKLVLTLTNGDDILETTCIRIGFRQVQTVNLSTAADARLLFNGSSIRLYGTNLHESNPETGRVTDIDFIRREYELMKQYNINAVRMSHYPHSPLYYALADEYGLYVMDEANIENHGLSTPGTAYQASLIDRLNNMMTRAMNNPSVFSWSMGNEASLSTVSTALLTYAGEKDPSRPRHAQFADGSRTSTVPELHSGFYGPAQSTSQSASGGWWQNVCNNLRPSLMAEYAHAMGNSNGNLDSFIEIFDLMPKAIGGFIWEWADHGLWTPVPGNPDEKYLAFDGDWDGVLRDGNFCMDGMVTADRKPYPQMTEVKYSYRHLTTTLKDNDTFTINNKHLFTNANEYDMVWELVKNGSVVQSGKDVYDVGAAPAGVVQQVIVPNPPPNVTAANYQGPTMTSADFPVPFEAVEDISAGDEFFFNVYFTLKEDTVWAEKGYVVSASHMPVNFGQNAKIQAPFVSGAINVADGENSVSVTGKDFEITIDKSNGVITTYKFMDRDLLASGPAPNFWRAPIDNEYPRTSTDFNSFGVWRNIGSTRATASVDVKKSALYTTVTVSGSFTSTRPGTYTTTYTIYPNGEVNVDYNYTFGNITGNNRYLQEIGSMMTVKSDFENITWFGRGPGETYNDRKWGNFVGLYESTVTDQEFPYAITQEMGNKVETRWLALTDDDGFGMVIKGDPLVEFNALHYTPEMLGARRYQHMYELTPMEDICLRVNLTSAGVGGNDSWGRIPEDKYRPMAGNNTFNYSYSILPVENLDTDAAMNYGKTEYVLFSVKDGDTYTPIDDLGEAAGKTLRAWAEIEELASDSSKTAVLALYDATGRLAGIKTSAPLPMSKGDTKTISVEMDMPADVTGMYVKLFVWDSESYVPSLPAYELK